MLRMVQHRKWPLGPGAYTHLQTLGYSSVTALQALSYPVTDEAARLVTDGTYML